MSFERTNRRPDFAIKAKPKNGGETVGIFAGWRDDRFDNVYLRNDARAGIDFIVLVLNDGRKIKVDAGRNSKDGTHNVSLYLNELEDQRQTYRAEPEPEPYGQDVDSLDFSDIE